MEKSYKIEVLKSLLFLPLTNSQLEWFISFMGNVKKDWRWGLKEETVEVLARITIEGPDLKDWTAVWASNAIEHWYKQNNCRTEQSKRKPYEKRQSDNVHKSLHEKDFCRNS